MKRPWSRPPGTFRPVRDFAMAPPPTLTLAEVLEEALIWQPEAEECIAACVAPGGKTAELARRTALVSTAYAGLLEVAQGLAPTPEQQEAVRLLTFHHRLVHEALYFGFRPDSPSRDQVAARFRGGLAAPGQRLAALYERVALGPAAGLSQLLEGTREDPATRPPGTARTAGTGSGHGTTSGSGTAGSDHGTTPRSGAGSDPGTGTAADRTPGTDPGRTPRHGRDTDPR